MIARKVFAILMVVSLSTAGCIQANSFFRSMIQKVSTKGKLFVEKKINQVRLNHFRLCHDLRRHPDKYVIGSFCTGGGLLLAATAGEQSYQQASLRYDEYRKKALVAENELNKEASENVQFLHRNQHQLCIDDHRRRAARWFFYRDTMKPFHSMYTVLEKAVVVVGKAVDKAVDKFDKWAQKRVK